MMPRSSSDKNSTDEELSLVDQKQQQEQKHSMKQDQDSVMLDNDTSLTEEKSFNPPMTVDELIKPDGAGIKVEVTPFVPFNSPADTAPVTSVMAKWPCQLMFLIATTNDDEWAAVIERLESHPEEAFIAGKAFGQTCLHAACIRYPPLHVVQALIAVNPAAVSQPNHAGETPLHIACYSSSEQVQELLVKTAPHAVGMADQYGDTPLHFSAKCGATLGLLQVMIKAYPQGVCKANRRGVTPFWLLPRSYLEGESIDEITNAGIDDYNDDWNLLCLFLKYSYEAMSIGEPVDYDVAVIQESLSRGYDDDDASCSSSSDDEDEDVVSNSSPYTAESYYWTVRAAAATPSCPREVLKFLCRMFPDEALRYNAKGFTPLHLACQVATMEEPNSWDEDEDGFREHVEATEGELQNKQHYISEEDVTLVQGDVDFLQQVTNNSHDSEEHESVVNILMTWSPRSVILPDAQGRLPLGHALLSGHSHHTICQLIAACPRMLEKRDAQTDFCMFQLAAIGSPELDSVYSLIRLLPELCSTVPR